MGTVQSSAHSTQFALQNPPMIGEYHLGIADGGLRIQRLPFNPQSAIRNLFPDAWPMTSGFYL
jgi:hypothetical protein